MSVTKKLNYGMDMTSGRLFGKILRFSLPLALTGILQLLYNTADLIVVGNFADKEALAAVGSTGSLVSLIVNIFLGLSAGCCAVIAKHFGAREQTKIRKVVSTAMVISLICGIIVGLVGFFYCRQFLIWMGSPSDVLDLATQYLKIYFVGMPANMVYNFGAAILRGAGDTKRPLLFLTVSGFINVALNLVFVINFHMSVRGVALATIISQLISALFVVFWLVRSKGYYHLSPKKLHIHKAELIEIAKIGIPAGILGAVASLSNVIIQSALNTFGSTAMAGIVAASTVEGFIYTSMNSLQQAAMTFTGQNYGAKKPENFAKVLRSCLIIVVVAGEVMGITAWIFGRQILGLFSPSADVVEYGMIRLRIIVTTYALCGISEVIVGQLRGLGCSMISMIVSIIGMCGVRVLGIITVFAAEHTLTVLFILYPISWTVTGCAQFVTYCIVKKRVIKKIKSEIVEEAAPLTNGRAA